jgi:hypothetical protein
MPQLRQQERPAVDEQRPRADEQEVVTAQKAARPSGRAEEIV